MKPFITKILIAIFGLSLAAAPVAASAAQWGVGVNVSGPGYAVHAGYNDGWHHGYVNPGGPYRSYPYGRHPAPVWGPPRPAPVFYDGYYGVAPGGYYGYYWHGRWWAHRHWGNGVWVYF